MKRYLLIILLLYAPLYELFAQCDPIPENVLHHNQRTTNVNIGGIEKEVVVITEGETTSLSLPDSYEFSENTTFQWFDKQGLLVSEEKSIDVSEEGSFRLVINQVLDEQNLINNASFENTSQAVGSDYVWKNRRFNTALWNEGTYALGDKPQDFHRFFPNCQAKDQDNMMIINGAPDTNQEVWFQRNIPVEQNTYYIFIGWGQNIGGGSPAKLNFTFNNREVGNAISLSKGSCNWERFYYVWYSGNNTIVKLGLENANPSRSGNDFAIDNLFFGKPCEYNFEVDVIFGPKVEVEDQIICPKETKTIDVYGTTAAVNTITWHNEDGTEITSGNQFDITHSFDLNSIEKDTIIKYLVKAEYQNVDYTDTFEVRYVKPVLELDADQITCAPDFNIAALIDSSNELNNSKLRYEWLYNNTSLTDNNDLDNFLATNSGEYVLRTNRYGCPTQDTINIEFITDFNLDLGKDTILCDLNEFKITGNISHPLTQYEWTKDADPTVIGNERSLIATEDGTYTLKATLNDCISEDEIILTFRNTPEITFADDFFFCYYDTEKQIRADQDENPSTTYEWSLLEDPSFSSNDYILDIYQSGTYQLKANNLTCVNEKAVKATISEEIKLNIPDHFDLCRGDSIHIFNLEAYKFDSVTWVNKLDNTLISTKDTLVVENSGDFIFTGYKQGCFRSAEVNVTERNLPFFTFAEDSINFCSYDTPIARTVEDEIYPKYQWKLVNGLGALETSTFELKDMSEGLYELTTENEFYCQFKDSIYIHIKPEIQIDLGDDIILCEGGTATLSNQLNQDYDEIYWTKKSDPSFRENTETIDVTESDIYYLNITKDNCTGIDSIKFDLILNPIFSFDADMVQFCHEDSKVVSHSGDSLLFNYEWRKSGETGPAISSNHYFTVPESGTYELELSTKELTTEGNSCKVANSLQVNIIEEIDVDLLEDQVVCEGNQVILNNNEATDYESLEWINLSTNNTIGSDNQLLVTSSGNYRLIVTNQGCTQQDDINVTFSSNPEFVLKESELFCHEDQKTVNIIGPSSFDYQWYRQNDPISGETNKSLQVDESDDYKAIASKTLVSGNVCQFNDIINVTVVEEILVDLGTEQHLCSSETIDLSNLANVNDPSSYNYTWSLNQTENVISNNEVISNINVSGTYELQLEKMGCVNSTQVQITFNEIPDFSLATSVKFCFDESEKVISADGIENPEWEYTWQKASDPAFISNDYKLDVSVLGSDIYRLTINDRNATASCPSITKEIDVKIIDDILIDVPSEIEVCSGENISIENRANFTADQTEWYFANDLDTPVFIGETLVDPVDDGIYTIKIYKGDCFKTAQTRVIRKETPTFSIEPVSYFCYEDDIKSLIANGDDKYTYHWYENNDLIHTGRTFNPSSEGDFEVSAEYMGCQSNLMNTKVEISNKIEFDISPLSPICENNSTNISITSDQNLSYEWYHKSNLIATDILTIETGDEGFYTISASKVYHGKTCSTTKETELVVAPLPQATIKGRSNETHCSTTKHILEPNESKSNQLRYIWSKKANEQDEFTEISNEYILDISNQPGIYQLVVESIVAGKSCYSHPVEATRRFVDPGTSSYSIDTTFCEANITNSGIALATPSDLSYSYEYYYFKDDVEQHNINDIVVYNSTDEGIFYERKTLIDNHCKVVETTEFIVNIDRMPKKEEFLWEESHEKCLGEKLEIAPPLKDGYFFIWQDSIASDRFSTYSAGDINLDVYNGKCVLNLQAQLKTYEHPFLNLGADSLEHCNLPSLELYAGSDSTKYQYSWTATNENKEILEGYESENQPILNATEQDQYIKYTVKANNISPNNTVCSSTDSIFVLLKTCNSRMKLPNVFTPNGDFTNNSFGPYDYDGIDEFNMKIYNRWGVLMWETNNIKERWDGKKDGNDCPAGVYFWVIKSTYLHPKPEDLIEDYSNNAGSVTLLR
ncbi:gliding motility-associated C-terminal domain-containing protein [Aureibacter tunicatorum]|uniref:Gliding motility-associated-like protein n=1 Tax=Aureibacter tunicatorum TaxID=866807 RepID=A0AAE3XN84_9BACT|nr:gliding motility-associated C-terminal domain-containing protein [Aureibacter tunicatorum]MDR6239063.1 gliding motility-associated-like protein [Aureibacter tunicatorum]BDD05011.1 hypothetical protein AUTU_24940 [Aureibacter tunicatorum]